MKAKPKPLALRRLSFEENAASMRAEELPRKPMDLAEAPSNTAPPPEPARPA